MTDLILPESLVFGLLESTDRFPIDLDDAWKWIGWSKKQDAKELLLNNFRDGKDFLRKGVKSPAGGRPSESIVLTVDCFKSLAMMAGTPKGQKVRDYFIDCENELKRKLKEEAERSRQIPQLTTIQILAQVTAQMAEQERLLMEQNRLVQIQQTHIDNLLEIQRQAEAELTALPYSDLAAPQKSTRIKINNLVRNYAQRKNMHHGKVWSKLYAEFRDRCHVDAKRRAENQGKKLAIDVIESLGLMEELYAIASEILKEE